MKKLVLFLTLLLSPVFAKEGEFDAQMGKGTGAWHYVKTGEDAKRLAFFSEVFQNQMTTLKEKAPIPKKIHFIWLGSEKFPKKSKHRLLKWIEKHPRWEVNFWTDSDQEAPVGRIQVRRVAEFPFRSLEEEYHACENYGEKAKVLAYEILLQEGGLYVDHDVFPFKSFNTLNGAFDFYCGLEELAPSILSTSVIPSPHLIGAKPHHPILEAAATWLKENWKERENSFGGSSSQAQFNLAMHRTFWALSEGIERGINPNRDRVFPSSYFSEKKRKRETYAIHLHEKSWIHLPSSFEAKMEKQFAKLLKQEEEAIVWTFLFAVLSFFGSIFLLVATRKIHREN